MTPPRNPGNRASTKTGRTQQQADGQVAEAQALAYLQERGLSLVERNFRCKTGEIDLIMRDRATLVFVEVRKRQSSRYGGAMASVTVAKQARLVSAAQFYLQRYNAMPPCRFDVVAMEGDSMHWLQNAIEA